jgi:hypothetical protein
MPREFLYTTRFERLASATEAFQIILWVSLIEERNYVRNSESDHLQP